MLHKLKENLPTIEILLGFCVFLCFVLQNSFPSAMLSLIFFLYLWLFTAIILEQYNIKNFIYLIGGSGILVSVSLFCMLGVEELPYPENAIIFHAEGIAKSLLIFFVSTVPLILTNKSKTLDSESLPGEKQTATEDGGIQEHDDEKWEEASMEDLQSGNFEPIYKTTLPTKFAQRNIFEEVKGLGCVVKSSSFEINGRESSNVKFIEVHSKHSYKLIKYLNMIR